MLSTQTQRRRPWIQCNHRDLDRFHREEQRRQRRSSLRRAYYLQKAYCRILLSLGYSLEQIVEEVERVLIRAQDPVVEPEYLEDCAVQERLRDLRAAYYDIQ